jgi:hypothetical protein
MSHDGKHDNPDLADARNPHASATRWRHQESSAFLRHAAHHSRNAAPREEGSGNSTHDLAKFLNTTRVESGKDEASSGGNFKPIMIAAAEATGQDDHRHGISGDHDGKEIVCGPLLNYRRMEGTRWFGSVLIVLKGGGKTQPYVPTLVFRRAGQTNGHEEAQTNGAEINGMNGVNGVKGHEVTSGTKSEGECLYSDPRNTFYAFAISLDLDDVETKWEYSIPNMRYSEESRPRTYAFYVPAATESMRMMFHSCNGFSVGTDEEAWSGPALWNDVIRRHEYSPFHVMCVSTGAVYRNPTHRVCLTNF